MQKRQTQRSSDRRSAILNCALKCFSTAGYESTSIEDICASSGASIGSIYHHFGSKEGVCAALYLHSLTRYYEDFEEKTSGCPTTEELVRALIHHQIDWSVENPEMTRFLITFRRDTAIAAVREEIESMTRSKLKLLIEALQQAAQRKEVLAMPSAAYIALIVGPCQEIVRLWVFNRLRGSVTEIRDALSDAAWRSLKT